MIVGATSLVIFISCQVCTHYGANHDDEQDDYVEDESAILSVFASVGKLIVAFGAALELSEVFERGPMLLTE